MIFITLRYEAVQWIFDFIKKQSVMRRDFLSFIGGMLVGAIFGVLVVEEDKKKIRQTLTKQI